MTQYDPLELKNHLKNTLNHTPTILKNLYTQIKQQLPKLEQEKEIKSPQNIAPNNSNNLKTSPRNTDKSEENINTTTIQNPEFLEQEQFFQLLSNAKANGWCTLIYQHSIKGPDIDEHLEKFEISYKAHLDLGIENDHNSTDSRLYLSIGDNENNNSNPDYDTSDSNPDDNNDDSTSASGETPDNSDNIT